MEEATHSVTDSMNATESTRSHAPWWVLCLLIHGLLELLEVCLNIILHLECIHCAPPHLLTFVLKYGVFWVPLTIRARYLSLQVPQNPSFRDLPSCISHLRPTRPLHQICLGQSDPAKPSVRHQRFLGFLA